MRNNFIQRSIGRNMSCENNSTGGKSSRKAFSFGKKKSSEATPLNKYTCQLQNNGDGQDHAEESRTKLSANIYKKSSKGKTSSKINKSSSKHSMKCSVTNSKMKAKMKKNGFFDTSEKVSSRRHKEDSNLADQAINSNPNTDRGHYHNLVDKEIMETKQSEKVEIFKRDQKDLKIKKIITKNKIANLRERSIDDGQRTQYKYEKPKLEIQIDSIFQSNKEFGDGKADDLFRVKHSTPNTLEIETESKDLDASEQKVRVKLSKQAQMIMDKLKISNPGGAYEDHSINISKMNEDEKGNLI